MTQSIQYDGDPLLRVRGSTVELTQSAELGAVGAGSLTVNDVAGTQEIVGQKDFLVTQDDCTLDVVFRGYIEDREYKRGAQTAGPAREIDISVQDLNAMLSFVEIGTDGNRTTETIADRLTWLLDTYLPTLGTTRVTFDTTEVGPSDFTGQHPTDVLSSMVLAAGGFNFHVQDYGSGPELIFRNDNLSPDDLSTIYISNRLSDVDWETVFPPLKDFVLTRRPGNVASKVRFEWAKAPAVVEENTATAAAFNGERDVSATDSNIKTHDEAVAAALRELDTHSTEEDSIAGTILLPPEAVNLVMAGYRIGVRLEHLQNLGGPGITSYFDADDWVYCRVLERTVRPKLKPTRLYEMPLKLSPQEGFVNPFCGTLDRTPNGVYQAIGGPGSGGGDFSNDSPNYCFYFRAGLTDPVYPTFIGTEGRWHFPDFGPPDYWGNDQAVEIRLSEGADTPGGVASVLVATGAPGDTFTVDVDPAGTDDSSCVSWIHISQAGEANSLYICVIGKGTATIHTRWRADLGPSGRLGWSDFEWVRT